MKLAGFLRRSLLSWRFTGWIVCGTALVFFAAGSLTTAQLNRSTQVGTDGERVFQLLIYHAVPGKVPDLVARFRDASKLLSKHGLNIIGYWVPEKKKAPFDDTFIYLVAHPSPDEAKKRWDAFHADPAFQEYVKSENANKLIEKVDSTFMRPTDFSALK